MARLARLVVAGQAHLVLQRGHSGAAVFVDEADRRTYLDALGQAAKARDVQLHGYALGQSCVMLLLTPGTSEALARTLQDVGRRYVTAFNRRHGRSGTLWDGRFRCAVVEPGTARLDALRLIDGETAEAGTNSAPHRTGGVRDPMLSDPPEYWSLGNTPFERELAWRDLLAAGLPASRSAALLQAASGGWVAGSAAFAAQVTADTGRPARPRPRGRPPRPAAS